MSESGGLVAGIKSLGSLVVSQNQDSSIIKLLTTTVKSLDSAIKTMDRFLKNKNIDVGKAGRDLKEKAGRGWGFLKKKAEDIKEDIKAGPKDTSEEGQDVKAGLMDRMKGWFSSGVEPPEDFVGPIPQAEEKLSLRERLKNGASKRLSGLQERFKGSSDNLDDGSKSEFVGPVPKSTLQVVTDSVKDFSFKERLTSGMDKIKDLTSAKKEESSGFVGPMPGPVVQDGVEGKLDDGNELVQETNLKLDTVDTSVKDLGTILSEKLDGIGTGIKDLLNKPTGGEPIDASGKSKKGWFSKLKDRMTSRKEEVQEEKDAAKKEKKKEDPSWLTKIMDNILMIGGLLTAGFGFIKKIGLKKIGQYVWKGVWAATKWTGRLLWKVGKNIAIWTGQQLWKGLQWLGTKAANFGKAIKNSVVGMKDILVKKLSTVGTYLKNLPGKIASGLKNIISGLIPQGVKDVFDKGKNLLSKGKNKLLSIAKKLPGKKAIGTFLLKRALPGAAKLAGFIFSGPVGWAIGVGSLLWDGYQLYKYISRNDIPDSVPGKLTRLRLLSYGLSGENKSIYSKMFELEEILGPVFTYNQETGIVAIGQMTEDQSSRMMETFNVSPDDPENLEILNKWYTNRFAKAYAAYLKAIWSVNPTMKPGNVDQMSSLQVIKMLENYECPKEIFNALDIPDFENPHSSVLLSDFTAVKSSVLADVRSGNRKGGGTDAEVERLKKEQKQRSENNLKERLKPEQDRKKTVKKDSSPIKDDSFRFYKPDPPSDGEVEPKSTGGGGSTTTSNTNQGRSPMAGGPLVQGDGTHVGIRLNNNIRHLTGLDPSVYKLLTGMAKEYHELTGKSLGMNQGFRSYDEQMALHKKNPSLAAKPGRSLHEKGLAVDINSVDIAVLEKMGLLKKYGFSASVGGETWHIEPIGISMDIDGAKNDLSIRKKLIEASPGRGGGGLGLIKGSKKSTRNLELAKSIFNAKPGPVPDNKPFDMEGAVASSWGGPSETKPTTTESKGTTFTLAGALAASQNDSMSGGGGSTGTSIPQPAQERIAEVAPNDGEVEPKSSGSVGSGGTKEPVKPPAIIGEKMGPESKGLAALKQASIDLKVDVKLLQYIYKRQGGQFIFTDGDWSNVAAILSARTKLPSDQKKATDYQKALAAGALTLSAERGWLDLEGLGITKSQAVYAHYLIAKSGYIRLVNRYEKVPRTQMSDVTDIEHYRLHRGIVFGKTIAQFLSLLKNDGLVNKNQSTGGAPLGNFPEGTKDESYEDTTELADLSGDIAGTSTSSLPKTPSKGTGSGDGSLLMVNNSPKVSNEATSQPVSSPPSTTVQTQESISTAPVSIGKPGSMDVGGQSGSMDAMSAINQAAKMTGVDVETMVSFAKLESGLRTGAKAGTSSATGLFQFTKGTWDFVLKKHGKKYGIPAGADPKNPLHNALMAGEYIKDNMSFIKDHAVAGIPKPIALYLAHFLGPTGASKFIKHFRRSPNTLMKRIVGGKQYGANQASMGGKTAGQFLEGIKARWAKAQNTDPSAYGVKDGVITGPSSNDSESFRTYESTPATSVGDTGYGEEFNTDESTAPKTYSFGGLSGLSYNPMAASEGTPTATQPQQTQQAPMLNSEGIEATLIEQTQLLSQMVSALQSIDKKFDPSKLYGDKKSKESSSSIPTPKEEKETPKFQPTQKGRNEREHIPRSSVDLSRRSIMRNSMGDF